MIQSTTGHVKPCGKQEGPSSKPKYYLVPVPQTNTGGQVENTKAIGITVVKELGKITP